MQVRAPGSAPHGVEAQLQDVRNARIGVLLVVLDEGLGGESDHERLIPGETLLNKDLVERADQECFLPAEGERIAGAIPRGLVIEQWSSRPKASSRRLVGSVMYSGLPYDHEEVCARMATPRRRRLRFPFFGRVRHQEVSPGETC